MAGDRMSRSARLRWSTASELLRLVYAEPGITRTAACERLALASGAATELIERLRGARLLAEHRADRGGPGRPTTVLGPHPRGPLAAVVDLSAAGWRVLLGDLAGALTEAAAGSYGDREPAGFLPEVAGAVGAAVRREPGRVGAVVAAVAGAVSGTRLLQFSTRGWHAADLGVLAGGPGVPLLVGNDATLGGIAEARGGAVRGARAALHILVAVGVGGALLVDGRPVTGARGAGGEYGHLPLGDPDLACPCGARGCWDLMVDGRALARHRGDPVPRDPFAYGRNVLDAVRSGKAPDRDRRAVERTARALGAGIAGLVNLHDPDAVTLAGLAPGLRAGAPEAFADAYRGGLMAFHRADPPPVADAVHGADGPVRGALALGFDEITGPAALARWGAHRTR
ncbi:ROK family protein [Nocardiopsis sp. CC223A]|uniref:ROK family protein n=1 Tax=Nocardiopsis sp. CC223A TaxID=3044051 RepID=UPI00279604A8|nr:ROK family protein [Nocardiopsis sp. CC223A]